MNHMNLIRMTLAVGALSFGVQGLASNAVRTEAAMKPVLADVSMLKQIGATVLAQEPSTGVGFARLNTFQQMELSRVSHARGSCAGFEELQDANLQANNLVIPNVFGELAAQDSRNRHFAQSSHEFTTMVAQPTITAAVSEVSVPNIQSTVEFLSNYETRDNRSENANDSVEAFKQRIEATLAGTSLKYKIDLISHKSTDQKSIRVSVTGSTRPNEIVVAGGHIDSINQDWFGEKKAPGADDNASGSACLLEALRIMAEKPQPERTVEFFWYAGEESGLLGSAEIARDYKAQKKDVVGVVQLDMTSFPGAGEFVLGSMNDFTSAWMRSYLTNLNGLYINAKIVDDKCGYGCSDHASWYKQGYPTLMPFEATFNGMNHKLHTAHDVVDKDTNFKHAAMFSKIVLAIVMDLGNSTDRQP